MLTGFAFRNAAIFAVAGAIGRFLLRDVETRWQIAAFWCAILTYELLVRPALGKPVAVRSTLWSLIAVTAAIVAMKVAVEGKITH